MIYKISITDDQKNYAWDIAKNTVMGMRKHANGTKENRYGGVLGEIILCDILGIERKKREDFGTYDNGIDFVIGGKNIDLKVQMMKVDFQKYYSNNLFACQHESSTETEVYLFAVINTQESTIQFNGWIRKNGIKQEWFYPEGASRPRGKSDPLILRAGVYEVMNRYLQEFNPHTFTTEMLMFDTGGF